MIASNPPEDDPLAGLGLCEDDFRPAVVDAEREEQKRFLKWYRKIGQRRSAAYSAKVAWGKVLRWEKDKRFARKMKEVFELFRESVLLEMQRRAIVGVPRMKFYKGDPISILNEETGEREPYIEYQHSDRLLLALVQSQNPEFRVKDSPDVSVNLSTNVAVQIGLIEDPGFYGNEARLQSTAAPASPVLRLERPESVQAAGVRSTVGEDVLRTADGS